MHAPSSPRHQPPGEPAGAGPPPGPPPSQMSSLPAPRLQDATQSNVQGGPGGASRGPGIASLAGRQGLPTFPPALLQKRNFRDLRTCPPFLPPSSRVSSSQSRTAAPSSPQSPASF
ncbi:hypothetical protein E2320_005666 [Naja naja]|nr:hypothetical protein E2320_005666 [Naja naja]